MSKGRDTQPKPWEVGDAAVIKLAGNVKLAEVAHVTDSGDPIFLTNGHLYMEVSASRVGRMKRSWLGRKRVKRD